MNNKLESIKFKNEAIKLEPVSQKWGIELNEVVIDENGKEHEVVLKGEFKWFEMEFADEKSRLEDVKKQLDALFDDSDTNQPSKSGLDLNDFKKDSEGGTMKTVADTISKQIKTIESIKANLIEALNNSANTFKRLEDEILLENAKKKAINNIIQARKDAGFGTSDLEG